ncbi:MAG: hypothetical protein IKC64_03190, partial [Clostridia bacterium]|nr:hypothetical protein [Clostridia bacterium]
EFNKKFYQVEFAKRDTTLPLVSRFIEIHSRVDSATDALNFATALENEILPLSKYFTLLDQDEKGKDLTHEERFEHTFYSLASTAVAEAIGKTIGSEIDLDCEMLRDGEDEIEKANIALIENMLLQRIDVRDPDYAFLQGEADDSALRLLFKHHARALLKLKPCMILSPSSVSVLMRPEEFESFDVVIVDEASQLEPVSVLPALFRARKCVIVGDENQMPPISHFRIVEETPDAPLPPSVLALALHNNSFIAQELRCHYRSQTESLIRFSQGRYYGAMKTFPAPVPKTDTLGFNDVYTPQGYCSGGVNQAEANAVVDVIAKHFEKYYVDGVMKRSLAVVAFGESQIDEIKSKAKTDPRLKKFNHDPENEQLGVFYRAVEKVQGQEADDLILSVTYGRDSYGDIYMNFGELNKSVGERIFNVAVTRARQSVTLVHSILPEQFGERNVPFVADYMRTAIRFANGGKDQFVDVPAKKGFVRSVADYICSLGFEQDRVVTGYGVTNGSVRIPIAILSEDKEKALCGIWCERDNGNEYDYVDLNVRHYESLIGRDWKLTTVYAHDWKIAREETKQNIKKFINQVLEQIKREQADK